ncbi:MAG TPA: flagellar basal body protein [Nevskiaceae bacterium]|nr:flagellar basal body protein [Nevskiaceae bacterium]
MNPLSRFDQVFGVHAQALPLHRQRLELLASNLANADTPGYKARDLDFASALAAVEAGPEGSAQSAVRERVVLQPSRDGNTVDAQREQASFADAALRYQASLGFVEGRLKTLMTALSGQ